MKEPLVLIPGLLCDAYLWAAQRAALEGEREARVFELSAYASIPAMAAAALARAPQRFALAGHSLGGRIALEMLRQAPTRIARLALLDTGFHGTTHDEAGPRRALVRLAYAEGMAAVAEAWLRPMVHPDRLSDAPLMAGLCAMIERASPESFERQQEALIARPEAAALLPAIACPTLVACGRQDLWSPTAQHEDMAARIEGARLSIIEECGHMSPAERPEEVTALLREWLSPLPREEERAG
jgi:pimeloyl-ACP methyl ester carboxylesterase